jgi:hypothetical protein
MLMLSLTGFLVQARVHSATAESFVDGCCLEGRIHHFAGTARLHPKRFLFCAAPGSIPRHQRNVDRPIPHRENP